MRPSTLFTFAVVLLGCGNAPSSTSSSATAARSGGPTASTPAGKAPGAASASATAPPTNSAPVVTSAAPPRTIPLADFCSAAKKLVEDRLSKCSAKEKADLPPDPKRFEEQCMRFAAHVEADATIAPKCLAAFEKEGATWEGLVDRLDACRRVYVGKLDAGAKCAGDAECSGENLCLHEKCVAPQPAGAECEVSLDGRTGCVPGFVCHDEKEEKDTCKKVVAIGDACADAACPTDSVCLGGKCTAAGDVGAPCEERYECKQGLACFKQKPADPKGSCGALHRAGEPCEDRFDCVSDLCGDDHKCQLHCGFGG